MPRPDVSLYQSGDRIDDGKGSVGYVRECTSRETGRKFLRVYISEGARKGQWEWPEKFGQPQLDWHPHGLPEVCGDCERPFKGKPTGQQIFCVQCDRAMDARDRKRVAAEDSAPSVMRRRWVTPEMRVAEEAAKDIRRRQVLDEIDADLARKARAS